MVIRSAPVSTRTHCSTRSVPLVARCHRSVCRSRSARHPRVADLAERLPAGWCTAPILIEPVDTAPGNQERESKMFLRVNYALRCLGVVMLSTGGAVAASVATSAAAGAGGATRADGHVCTIVGTPGNDVLRGTSHRDVICGLGGNDRLIGGGGNDLLIGGAGNDTENGGAGNDQLNGDSGNDHLNGGAGNDTENGGAGNDQLNGDDGNDHLSGGAGDDQVDGENGDDTVACGTGTDTVNPASHDNEAGDCENGDAETETSAVIAR